MMRIALLVLLALTLLKTTSYAQSEVEIEEISALISSAETLLKENAQEAEKIWLRAIERSDHFNLDTLSIKVLKLLMRRYNRQKKYDKIFELEKKYLKDPSVYPKESAAYLSDVYMVLHICHQDLLNFDKALEYLFLCENYLRKYDLNLSSVYSSISNIQYRIGNYHKALEFGHLAYKEAEKGNRRNQKFVKSQSAAILSLIYYRIDSFILANKFYNQYSDLLKIRDKNIEFRSMHYVYSYGIHESEEDMEKLLRFNKQIQNSPTIEFEAKKNLSYIIAEKYLNLGNYENAISYFKYSLPIIADESEKHYPTLMIFKGYLRNGSPDSAMHYFDKYMEIMNKVHDENMNNNMNEMMVKYETLKKEAELNKKSVLLNRSIGGILSLVLLSGFLFYRSRNKQRIAKQEIELLKKDQRLLATDYLIQGQEKERKRIAQDLHDGLGGLLSSARLQMQNIEREINTLQQMNVIDKAEDLVTQAQSEVRRISHDMMPSALSELGLIAAVEDILAQISEDGQIIVNTSMIDEDSIIAEKVQVGLYRIIQEIMNNILKHAEAKEINFSLRKQANKIQLIVEDNGKGFSDEGRKKTEGIGLKGIYSRVDYLNGTIDLKSTPGKGTSYEILIPLDCAI